MYLFINLFFLIYLNIYFFTSPIYLFNVIICYLFILFNRSSLNYLAKLIYQIILYPSFYLSNHLNFAYLATLLYLYYVSKL